MQRLNMLKFLIAATLIVTGIYYMQHQTVQRQEKLDQLVLQIEDLTEMYENTARELKETHEEKLKLDHKLNEALEQIETVEERNQQLEQILFNQRQTYRKAVAMNVATMQALSTSSFTARQYERAWARLGARGLAGTGPALVQAEEIYGVNSLVLASIAYMESAGGMSKIAREKNNLFGLGAGGDNPYLNALSFATKEKSIYYTANLLRNSYLSRWGRNYRGDSVAAIGISFASDPHWANKVSRSMSLIARAAIPEGR